MSGIMLAFAGGSFGTGLPSVIGQAYGGGFYAGQIGVASVATHYLIVGPVASAESSLQWKTSATATAGTSSVIDGPANSNAMNNASHPAAYFCKGLTIGGYTDWYMPAKNELEVCYYNLKPKTVLNTTGSGLNYNAVPTHGDYTAGTPTQTSAANFVITTGAEAFAQFYYWTSTEKPGGAAPTGTQANNCYFGNGNQGSYQKNYPSTVRAIRRIPV